MSAQVVFRAVEVLVRLDLFLRIVSIRDRTLRVPLAFLLILELLQIRQHHDENEREPCGIPTVETGMQAAYTFDGR